MNDILLRTFKTFIQSFFGVAIPEFGIILTGNLPEDINGWILVIAPVLISSLSAGICAAWNFIEQHYFTK